MEISVTGRRMTVSESLKSYAEEKIGTVNLISTENVKRSTILYVFRGIKRFFISKYMVAIYVLIVLVIILFNLI